MKNNQLEKTDYAGQIDAAVAVIRQALGNRVTRTPAPEIFDVHCFCAVHDKPYTLHFVLQPSGLLRFSGSVKGQASNSPDNAHASGAGYNMRLGFFETKATPCAWCGDGSFHHCATYCGALVCGGRMRGNTFHCRPSCGAEWVGVPLKEVKGTVQDKPRRPSSSGGSVNVARPIRESLRIGVRSEPPRITAGHLVPTGRK
jgi:hypothetical protein